MKTLFSILLSITSSASMATQCLNDYRPFEYLMDTNKTQIVTKFMEEKLEITSDKVIDIHYAQTKNNARALDYVGYGIGKIIDVFNLDTCPTEVVHRGSKGKGTFTVTFENSAGQECQTRIKVKGHLGWENNYNIKLSHKDESVDCLE